MTIEGDGLTPPADAPKPQTSFQRMGGVLFTPVDTFEDIARKPDVLAVLLTILVIGYVAVALTMPRVDFDAMFAAQAEQVRGSNPNISDADLDRMQRFTMGFVKVMTFVGPVLLVVWQAAVAGVLFLAFRLFGGDGTYRQAFSATVYAWLPLVLFQLISTVVILARGSFDPTTAATLVKSNPAFLVGMKEHPVLYSLLSSFDVFTIWTVILLIVGFAALSRSSKAKSAALVVSMWMVAILVKVGFAALGAARAKG